jgi:hypothetical protein
MGVVLLLLKREKAHPQSTVFKKKMKKDVQKNLA